MLLSLIHPMSFMKEKKNRWKDFLRNWQESPLVGETLEEPLVVRRHPKPSSVICFPSGQSYRDLCLKQQAGKCSSMGNAPTRFLSTCEFYWQEGTLPCYRHRSWRWNPAYVRSNQILPVNEAAVPVTKEQERGWKIRWCAAFIHHRSQEGDTSALHQVHHITLGKILQKHLGYHYLT